VLGGGTGADGFQGSLPRETNSVALAGRVAAGYSRPTPITQKVSTSSKEDNLVRNNPGDVHFERAITMIVVAWKRKPKAP
jgi:hypothetical protein